MNRITRRMNTLKAANKKAFVAYIVSGDPRPSVTLPAMHKLVEHGVDIIELGVPFSDPMAEGPVIQLGHERALKYHVSLMDTIALVKQFREQDQDTPVVLMGYDNPIERKGYEFFANEASQAGVDGVLTVDLPPEEAGNLNTELKRVGLENIFLLAPTTSATRIKEIVSIASGFIYYVSLKGVTGAGHLDLDSVKAKLKGIRKVTDLPLCVGFGIKDGQSAKAVSEHGDGAVVGSVFVDRMGALAEANDEDIVAAVGEIASNIRAGLDN